MTRIYLIRHAEAEGNLYRRAQGHWDGKLTALGLRQAEALAERFRDIQIDAVYASDLSRAADTASAILRGRSLQLAVTPRLRELCMGVWEGQPWGQLQYEFPEEMALFNGDLSKWQVEGSERFEAAQERMNGILAEIAGAHPGETVAVVSHGMAIKTFLYGALGIDPGTPGLLAHGDNTSVSLLEYTDGKPTVIFYNDNSHLGDLSTFGRQKWWRTDGPDKTSLRFVPMNLKDKADAELYTRSYGDSWEVAHGSRAGFVPNVYLATARAHSRADRQCVVKVMSGDEFAGVIELDPERGRREKCGWVSFLYLCPAFRHLGLGIQLLGYASAFFSNRGRATIRLHVAVTNENAIGFYKKWGFETIGVDQGVSSEQYLMEKRL